MTQQDEQATIWLTQDAYDKLTAELENMKGPRRQEIVAKVSAAREEGDLKENGGYHAAREEHSKLEGQILQLEARLLVAQVGEPKNDGTVSPGMTVTYKFVGDDDDDAETFLLGAREMDDIVDGIKVYSPQSPLGTAVIGAAKGDTVSYEAPNGKTLEVTVLDMAPFTG
jgi:transcription elongation factor GreA